MKTIALVVAAGRGERFGRSLPKQYCLLAGKPVIRYSLEILTNNPHIDAVAVVGQPDHADFYKNAINGLKLLPFIAGGQTRQQSVKKGLEAIQIYKPTHVLIHDAARPFVTPKLIQRLIDGLKESPAVIPATAVVDTLKRTDHQLRITDTVDRQSLWRAQTPQAFDYPLIYAAHEQYTEHNFTDDASLFEAQGISPLIVTGDDDNMKITLEQDLAKAERILAATSIYEYRCGMGFDVHAYKTGDYVTLGGIKIANHHSLEGHSDADVGLHALADAILGAIGAGDIGQHFSPKDMRWRGADSSIFIKHIMEMVFKKSARVTNADITFICENPKIGPHRQAMAEKIAALLHISHDRVNIKATTTEKLGFTGREEGIAAQAVVSIALPINH